MSSIVDDPNAFFDSLTKETPEEKKPEAPAPVAAAVEAPETPKPEKAPTIEEDPNAFFEHIAPKNEVPGKQEKAPDSVDLFHQSTEHLDPEKFDPDHQTIMSTWTPDEWSKFKQIRPDYPVPADKEREIFDAKRSGELKDEGPGFWRSALEGAKSFGRGVGKISTGILNPPEAGASEEDIKKYAEGVSQTARSLASSGLKAGETLDWWARKTGANMAPAIQDYVERRSQEFDPTHWTATAYQVPKSEDPELDFRRYQAGQAIDTARAIYERANKSIYSRMAQYPATEAAVRGILHLTGADKNQTPEQIAQHAKTVTNKLAEAQNYETDPDVEFVSSFITPGGLGMGGEFAAASSVLGLAGKVSKLAELRRGGEVQHALNVQKLAEDVDRASETGLFTKAMRGSANALENLSTAIEDFKKARPLATKALQFVPGAVLGYEEDKEHPYRGALLGALAEGTGVHALGSPKFAKIIGQLPKTLADLGEASAVAAGRGDKFALAGAAAEDKTLTKSLFGGNRGRFLDAASNIISDYGRHAVDNAALMGALGVSEGKDPSEIWDSIGQGILYGALHQTFGKVVGRDPISHAREMRQQDIRNYQAVQQMSPDSQAIAIKLQDWDTHLGMLQASLSQAQTAYADAVAKGDEKAAAEAGNSVQTLSKSLDAASKANADTRGAYAREVGKIISAAHEAANGPFKEGQKNVGIEVLTTSQIAQKLLQNNRGKFDPNDSIAYQQAFALAQMGHFFSRVGEGRGLDFKKGVPTALEPIASGIVFDPLKSSVVINADILQERTGQGYTLAEALRHETGHALSNIPEFRNLMIQHGVEEGLFDQTYTDLDGTNKNFKEGQFSDKALVDLYFSKYLSKITPLPGETPKQAEERFARSQGFWDEQNRRWNEQAIAEYMKDEVRADLYGKHLGNHRLDSFEAWQQHALDWARTKKENSLVRKAIEGVLGSGGTDPYNELSSPATGATFSPELLSAYRNAFRAFSNLNGQVSSIGQGAQVMPMISPMKMAKTPSLRAKYGKDSGLFKTEFRATVFDKDGNPVGVTTLPTQNAFEGHWGMQNGQLVQRSGYGQLPKEASGLAVPEGGSVQISREIVLRPDGETPEMLSRREIKDLLKNRAQIIRDAIDNAYQGEPGGFRAISEDGLSYRGKLTPAQIEAIRNLPESIVPAKVKDAIFRFNDLITEGLGKRMLIDYAARVDDRGRAVSFAPKIYDLVPIGLGFSKEGNMYAVTISVSRLLDKLNLWGDRLPGRLAPWGGDKEAFFREFATKYLPNHMPIWENPAGADKPTVARPGETDLDPNPEVAKQKKDIFNDFLNLTSNDFRGANLDRTTIPRRKGDPRGKDANRTIMSVRLDSIADMLESSSHPLPINYELQKINYLPARGAKAKQEEPTPFRVDEQNPILKALNVVTPRAANDDVRRISEDYVKGAGMQYRPHGQAIPVNEDLAKRIADHYEAEKDNPNAPEVKKAYTALANETVNQWKAFEKAGYTATPWTGEGQPYANSAEMMKDVRDNKHLYYFTTEGGFGETGISDQMREENPMLAPSGVNFNGAENVPVNDVFRVVHDIVGHGANGYEFGPKGEFNAYLEHSRMFSDAAKPALAAETLAQNSWVNYGSHLRDEAGNLPKKGQPGYIAPQDRPFAPQKNLALPQEFIDAAEEHAKNTVDTQTQKSLTGGINQSPSDATQQTPRYLPERGTPSEAIPGAEGAREEDSQARASERVRLHSGLAAVARAASSAGEEGVQGSAQSPATRKDPKGEDALREYADEHDLWSDPDAFFEQWQFDGSEAGGEHQVSFPDGPDVVKRTPNPNYPDWASYFDSLNVHNTLFPEAALTFRKFQNVEGSGGVDIDGQRWPAGLYSEVSQPKLEIVRGLTVPETDALMETRGFYQVRPFQYYNPELKMFMTDLHPGNAVMLKDGKGNEMPYVIDSYIRPEGEKDARDVQRVNDMLAGEEQIPDLRMRYLPAKKLTVQHPSEEKEGSVGGDLDLVHFGAYGINTADPKKMGKGLATGIDRAGLPKTYFYLKGTPYEAGIKEQTPYLAKVDGNSIYDLDADPLGLKQTNREAMDKAIQDAGFAGYLSRKKKGQAFDAVAMFKKTKLAEAQPTDVFSKAEAKRRMEAGGPEIDYAAQDEAFYGPSVSYLPAQEKDFKDVTKKVPEVVEAAKQYRDGKISQEEYLNTVKKYMPYREMDEVPEPATQAEMEAALKSDKVPQLGKASETLKAGYRVGSRLDIPAYRDHGVWVVAVHDAKNKNVIGYEPVSVLNNVKFTSDPKAALGVATGEKAKSSFARIEGDWEPVTPEAAKAEAEAAMHDPEYIQVGMNPARHSWFYDRKTGQPVVDATRMVQIGGLVMVKNPVYAEVNDPRFEVKGKPGVYFLPAQPTVTKGGHVVVTDPEKPFTATPEILTRFLPASPQVNLEDYTDYPIIALTADRMGVGKAYVGPEGAKKETKLPRQGGAGFPTIYFTKDKDNNPVWAFSDKNSASRFLTRGRNIAKERGVDKFLVAPTLLNPNNHLHSPAGQSAYIDALNAAMEAGVVKPKQVDAHVKEILTRIKKSADLSPQQKEVIGNAKNFADLSKLVSEKALNFASGALLKEKASGRTLPIKLEDMERMGILPSSVAKALAHEGFYDLPDYSIVSLFEVPVDQQPEEGDFHHSYPWIVRGTPIGFLKNIYNLADVTSDTRVFSKAGKLTAQPVMTVMPALDPVKIKKALEDLKPIPAP
jgi:hypothetical protein